MSSFTPHRAARPDGFSRALRAEWAMFRSLRGLVLTLAASVLVTVSIGLLVAGSVQISCVTAQGEGPCPAPLLGPDGTAVNDRYFFVHQPLKGDGVITARVSDLTGEIRLPDAVPGVRNVTKGVVPWAKAGLLVRRSLAQGGSYAAVMLTGGHGVRMQHDFVHDVAGSPVRGPRWLRLTRSGETVTGYESGDGRTWTEVGTARLAGLPETVEIGLFATSPGDVREMAKRYAQAAATFDRIGLQGANGPWRQDDVGLVMQPDGTPHHPGRAVESGDEILVAGGGDIGPATMEGGLRADLLLLGGALGLIPVLLAAVRFGTAAHQAGPTGSGPPDGSGGPGLPVGSRPARVLGARAVVVGAVAFVTGLVAAGIVLPAGLAMVRANQNRVQPLTLGTELRVIVGYAALTAFAAVLALGLAALTRRSLVAAVPALALVVVPYLLASAGQATWLLTITPAAGFAITQSIPAFAHVDVDRSLLGGYYPLPPWAGLAVTVAYAGLALAAAIAVRGRSGATPELRRR
ncbi:DUF1349 domain-containing protein [Nonomuraea sp. MG754425]|uniref:DUF1349 domain-containing protein n=1 Tax=Nonomuraea sp. MG754425 TaxID=2570319 RepID=UPI001F3D565C|nr:DUF1349 domain-containing protein [Nonomuraea sp. MG754425]MCF6468357.1 DUF1349 domain-containing protein [Nonomuraea sp. MG754425]